jgi:hypothetical protein
MKSRLTVLFTESPDINILKNKRVARIANFSQVFMNLKNRNEEQEDTFSKRNFS